MYDSRVCTVQIFSPFRKLPHPCQCLSVCIHWPAGGDHLQEVMLDGQAFMLQLAQRVAAHDQGLGCILLMMCSRAL